jgi:hypothetical protein
MNGYAIVFGPCYGCGQVFGYNPHRVPSIRIGPDGDFSATGDRKPICQQCVDVANPKRIANGLEPIEVYPDSYEPIPEGEL